MDINLESNEPLQLTAVQGPLFTLQMKNESASSSFTLLAGVKSSSLLTAQRQPAQVTQVNGVNNIEITAAEALSAFRAVKYDGTYCNSTIDDLSSYAGVTTVAMTVGETGSVIRTGSIADSLWSWIPNQAIFISTNGVLTQTPPTTPLRRIGWAVSATQINLDPFPTIGA